MRFRLAGIAYGSSRLRNPIWNQLLRIRNVGHGTYIAPSVNVLGWRNTHIGKNSVICEQTCINVNNRSDEGIKISIGDNCFIGRRNFFNNGKDIILKDYCMTGLDCHFNGSNHIFADPFKPYIATGISDDCRIILGVNCWLGTDVTVIGNVSIGHGSVVGAGALVTKSIPPFSVAIGNPARVVKRFDMTSKTWIEASDFTPEMEILLPTEDSYLKDLRLNQPRLRMPIAAAGKNRGDLP